MIKTFKLTLTVFILALGITSCSSNDDDVVIEPELNTPAEYNSEVVVSWFDLIKVLTTETVGYTPPVAARAFGYTGVALYEAVQIGMADKTSLTGKLGGLNLETAYIEGLEYHWPTVINTTLANMTKSFYSNASLNNYSSILDLEAQYSNQFMNEIDAEVIDRSISYAHDLVDKILLWSSSDGGFEAQFNNFPTEYQPLEGDQYWKPTAPGQLALQPYWGNNRPFVDLNVQNSIPVDPPVYDTDESSVFMQRAFSVYEVVNNITPEQTVIAEFWSDDPLTSATPPGHSIAILNQLIKDNDVDLFTASELFAKLSIGINDAFISCWKVKYNTNYPRPVTIINRLIDEDWGTVLDTPPFPEYTSGHSVQTGALAYILASAFGDDYSFTDRTHVDRTDIDGTPRNYATFIEMAEEAAVSRLYGGIHFQESIDLGLVQGYQIGENVVSIFED